jgi:hypothetical protein
MINEDIQYNIMHQFMVIYRVSQKTRKLLKSGADPDDASDANASVKIFGQNASVKIFNVA